jgi:hypothetical protein
MSTNGGDYLQARLKDGRPYSGEQRFAGTGMTRSCGKCGQHRPLIGFRKLVPWGMCCAQCRGVAA